MKIKPNYFVVLAIVVLILAFLFIQLSIKDSNPDTTSSQKENTSPQSAQAHPSVKYFSSSSDKVVISIANQTLYMNNPTTTIDYYALDDSNKPVQFREDERAFVRILGITRVFSNNIEILHPKNPSSNSENYTIFKGNITFPEAGVYLVKVCLGKSINLDEAGNKVWPFGCFEDQTSVQINVY